MKILIISSYLPYPLYSGGQVRLFNLIKELSEKHEITLICEKRDQQTNSDVQAVEKICNKVITVNRRKQWSFRNLFSSATSVHSFLVIGHTLPEMKQKIIEELANQKYDLIHVETYYVAQNLPPTKIPILLVEHNIEYQVYQKFIEQLTPILRPLLIIDTIKIKREEEVLWKSVSALAAVSEEDKAVMQKAGSNPSLVANGVSTDEFNFISFHDKSPELNKKILFIGDFKWIQNQDSAKYIITEIWPLIKQKTTIAHLWIVAREIPDSIKNLTNDPHVFFDEESSARITPHIFQEASVLLAPIRVGGGTSYKILEAMSCGTPVVTMPMSANAIHAFDNEEILVGGNAEELAKKTARILHDKELYLKISKNGRRLIEAKYTWKKIAKQLETVYQSIV